MTDHNPDATPRVNASRCKAHARSSGEQCNQPTIPGGTVCHYHGGAIPAVKRSAKLRLLDLVEPAIAMLARELVNQRSTPNERLRAIENVLDRSGFPRGVKVTLTDQEFTSLMMERMRELVVDPPYKGELMLGPRS